MQRSDVPLRKSEQQRNLKNSRIFRSGKAKLKKIKYPNEALSMSSSLPQQPIIRREDVVIDVHTSPKKKKNQFRIEGDTGWV